MALTSPSSSKLTSMPMQRIKTIMKSSPDVENISQEALFAMGKSAEIFVSHLANQAYENSKCNHGNTVEYKHLANVVNGEDIFGFLQEIIPHKITVREYYEIINGETKADKSDDSETSDTTDSESEE